MPVTSDDQLYMMQTHRASVTRVLGYRRGSKKGKPLPDVFCHLFRLREQAFPCAFFAWGRL